MIDESIHLSLLANQEGTSVINADGVVIDTFRRRIKCGTTSQPLLKAFSDTFDSKMPLADIVDVLAEQGADQLQEFYTVLKHAYQDGALSLEYHDGGVMCGRFAPMSVMPLIVDVLGFSGRIQLARFAALQRMNSTLVLEAPIANARFELYDQRTISTITSWMAAPSTSVENSLLARLLLLTGLAVVVDASDSSTPDVSQELDGWTSHEMFFQFRSRQGFHTNPSGGLFFGAGRRDPLPATRSRHDSDIRIPLPVPTQIRSDSLESVVSRRVSTREFSQQQPSLAQLGELFWRTMRQTAKLSMTVNDASGVAHEFPLKRRPVPSGGAVHEIDAYVLANAEGELPFGLWRYDDESHEMVYVADLGEDSHVVGYYAQKSAALQEPPSMVVLFSARFDRIMWKYTAIPLAAILKHVGVLYQAFYLVATDMGLGVCALGSGESRAFSRMIGSHPAIETTVGEMLIGIPKNNNT